AKVIKRAWRTHRLRPETWAKRVWNMVRNDGTPDEKKFLGITPRSIRIPDDRYVWTYVWYIDRKILAKDDHQNGERLGLVSYSCFYSITYKIVEYSGWFYML
ncbi:17118_t:CDS:1, partial [Gigaspora rosea]